MIFTKMEVFKIGKTTKAAGNGRINIIARQIKIFKKAHIVAKGAENWTSKFKKVGTQVKSLKGCKSVFESSRRSCLKLKRACGSVSIQSMLDLESPFPKQTMIVTSARNTSEIRVTRFMDIAAKMRFVSNRSG